MPDDDDIFIYSAESSAEAMTIDLSDSITIDLSNYGAAQPTYTVSGIDTITLDNSEWATEWLVDREIVDQHKEEKRIRDSHPAVQYAYEQYQIMLNLARENDEIDPNEDIQ